MEASQALAIESFSYSWLTINKCSSDDLTEPLDSERLLEEAENFIFDIPISISSSLVHADEIFSCGLILPKYEDQSDSKAFHASNLVLTAPSCLVSSRTSSPVKIVQFNFLRKWQKSSKRIFLKYLKFFRPLLGRSRRSTGVDDAARKARESANSARSLCEIMKKGVRKADKDRGMKRKARSWSSSPQASSPRASPSCSRGDWSIDCSIDEAILYCKRSFGKLSSL
ncbi:hypothetical protein NMG60_11022797 [Bertholletia excelsa]